MCRRNGQHDATQHNHQKNRFCALHELPRSPIDLASLISTIKSQEQPSVRHLRSANPCIFYQLLQRKDQPFSLFLNQWKSPEVSCAVALNGRFGTSDLPSVSMARGDRRRKEYLQMRGGLGQVVRGDSAEAEVEGRALRELSVRTGRR